MTQTPEGRITVRVNRDPGGGMSARIDSSRPLGAVRWFEGKSVDETLRLLPLLYRVCGTAQAAAAVTSVENALRKPVTAGTLAAREILVLAETLREHLLRMITGRQQEGAPRTASLADVMRLPGLLSQQLFPRKDAFRPGGGELHRDSGAFRQWHGELVRLVWDSVTGCLPETFLQLDSADTIVRWTRTTETPAAWLLRDILDRGWAEAGQTELRTLPQLADGELDERLTRADADDFVAAPDWRGEVYETGALARNVDRPLLAAARSAWGNGLLTRNLARLTEIAAIPGRLDELFVGCADDGRLACPDQLPPGSGIGQVEAARGRLIHRVVLDDDHVAAYRMLAPTEWNFHPRGALATALSGLPPQQDLEYLASLLVEAVDPCVGYDLEVQPGGDGEPRHTEPEVD